MTLGELVTSLDTLDPRATIYAAHPWTADSPVELGDGSDAAADRVGEDGTRLEYFLDVAAAKSFLATRGSRTRDDKVRALILFAVDEG